MVYQPGVLYYKNRAGEKVGPVTPDPYHGGTYLNLDGNTRWFGPNFKGGQFTGRGFQHIDHHNDLIEPWIENGEVSVTKKLVYRQAIEPGEYGIVFIQMDSDGDYSVSIDEGFHTSSELLEAAEVLKELGEFLKHGKTV